MPFANRYIVEDQFGHLIALESVQQSHLFRIKVDVVGGPYYFDGVTLEQREILYKHFDGLCSLSIHCPSESGSGIIIKVVNVDSGYFIPPRIPDSFPDGEVGLEFEYNAESIRIAGCNFMSQLTLSPKISGILWVNERMHQSFFSAVGNLFRVLVAYRLLQLGGVLLHSAAVTGIASTYVFFGRSGMGKSTISRLMAEVGYSIISDDLNAIIRENQCFRVHQVPFYGDNGPSKTISESYTMTGFFQLKQGKRCAVQPLTGAHALQKLMVCSPFVNRDPYRIDALISNLTSLISNIKISELLFKRNIEFIPIIEKLK